ncbi:MAG: hypothetical protein HZR80_08285 [Candidatus Heimdallarchaeota archaeon]
MKFLTNDLTVETSFKNIPLEIEMLTESPDFVEFVKMISSSLDDGKTFDEILSSKIILQKAIEILKKIKQDEIIENSL